MARPKSRQTSYQNPPQTRSQETPEELEIPYRLHFSSQLSHVVVVGCGGTGGFVAEGLCRMLEDFPDMTIHLIDPDTVEPHNLRRQNFYPEEVGLFKAEALGERLARKYRRPIGYSTQRLTNAHMAQEGMIAACTLVIGCVDNPRARHDIANAVAANNRDYSRWWIDAGNGENYGQVLIGNSLPSAMHEAFFPDEGVCRKLPLPTVQMPELLVARPPGPIPADCAQQVEAGVQGPVINQMMASVALEIVRRIITQRCTCMGVFVGLDHFTMREIPAIPEAVRELNILPRGVQLISTRKYSQI